jgi:CHASE2 domain-containing sensor protein
MKLFRNRKGLSLHEAPAAVILLVIAGVAASVGALITTQVGSTMGAATAGGLAASNATAGIGQFSTMLPIIGIVIGAAIVIGLLFAAFFTRGMEAR